MDGGRKILVIDDETSIVEVVRILFVKRGYEVHVAFDATTGIEQIRSVHPDIVLTDMRLPDLSGVELLGFMKMNYPGTPVVLMTAQVSFLPAGSIEGELYRSIQKPFRNDELVAMVEGLLLDKRITTDNASITV